MQTSAWHGGWHTHTHTPLWLYVGGGGGCLLLLAPPLPSPFSGQAHHHCVAPPVPSPPARLWGHWGATRPPHLPGGHGRRGRGEGLLCPVGGVTRRGLENSSGEMGTLWAVREDWCGGDDGGCRSLGGGGPPLCGGTPRSRWAHLPTTTSCITLLIRYPGGAAASTARL